MEEEDHVVRLTLLGEVSTVGMFVRTCSDELSARLAHVSSRCNGLGDSLLFPKAETCIKHATCSRSLIWVYNWA